MFLVKHRMAPFEVSGNRESVMWPTGPETWCLQTCRYRDQQLPALPYSTPAFRQELPPKPSHKRRLRNSRLERGILERCNFWFKAPGGAEKKFCVGLRERKRVGEISDLTIHCLWLRVHLGKAKQQTNPYPWYLQGFLPNTCRKMPL